MARNGTRLNGQPTARRLQSMTISPRQRAVLATRSHSVSQGLRLIEPPSVTAIAQELGEAQEIVRSHLGRRAAGLSSMARAFPP